MSRSPAAAAYNITNCLERKLHRESAFSHACTRSAHVFVVDQPSRAVKACATNYKKISPKNLKHDASDL